MKRFLYHSCLTLFLFLLFFTASAQQPHLVAVSVDTIYPQKIEVSWFFDKDIDSVSIYKCTQNCHIENNFYQIAKLEMTDLEWIDTVASATYQNYYSIGWEWSGKSPPHNNMVLKVLPSFDGCKNSISLSWNPYINMMDTLGYYNVLYRKAEVDTSSFTWLASTEETQYSAKLLESNTVYEFVIQAVSKKQTPFAFSNIVQDTTGTVITTPVNVSITRVSVFEDRAIEIDINTDDFYDPLNIKNLYLLRRGERSDPLKYISIDSLPYSATNEYYFLDKEADPHSGLYYYQAMVAHQCKANDYSNILTNIYLRGNRVESERYKDSISFHQIGVDSSDIYSLFVNGRLLIDASLLTIIENKYLVDVEKFMEDGQAVVYQIKSARSWYSNTLSIDHEPIVYFSNAFYPQGLDIDKTFYPIIIFPSEVDYLFTIYNRWGQELYRSTLPPVYKEYYNMQGRWDGTFQGKDCPADIYAYKLSYTYNNGKGKLSKSGTFMLVR